MLWMDLIGEGGGTFYLDLHGCEPVPGDDSFVWRLTGVVGDGQRESGLLVEAGEELRLTFVNDAFDALPDRDPFPDTDRTQLEEAVAEAAGRWLRERSAPVDRRAGSYRPARVPAGPNRGGTVVGESPRVAEAVRGWGFAG